MKYDDALEALAKAGMTEAVQVIMDLRERKRRTAAPRRPPVSRKVTPELRAEIVHLYMTTKLTTHQIAAQLNVNQGRVSEAVSNLRR